MSNPLQSWSFIFLTLVGVRRFLGWINAIQHVWKLPWDCYSHTAGKQSTKQSGKSLPMPAKPVLQSVWFCWVSSERVQRSENWLENYSDPRRFVMETSPMLWMRTQQHNCYSKPRHTGYLPLSRDLSHLFLSRSVNSLLKQWAKHSNIRSVSTV